MTKQMYGAEAAGTTAKAEAAKAIEWARENRPHMTEVGTNKSRDGYQAICAICGSVGLPQQFIGDAEAIAERHQEIGGFERRS